MKWNFSKFSITLCVVFSLIGCGGSEDSSTSTSTGIDNISYTGLPLTTNVNENTPITLSLGVDSASKSKLTYNWTVELSGESIEFTGQNTDTITFTAPEVEQSSTISVNVEFDLINGTLLGQKRDSATILVINDGPTENAAQLGKSTTLPEVETIDLSNVLSGSTWNLNEFAYAAFTFEGSDLRTNTSSQKTTHFTVNSNGSITSNVCGIDTPFELDTNTYGANISCESGSSPVLKRYQDNNAFRMEARCEDEVVLSNTYRKIADETKTDFGSITLDFTNREAQTIGEDVCGTVVVSEVYIADAPSKAANTTTIKLNSTYGGEAFSVQMFISSFPRFGVYYFRELFDPSNINSLTFESEELPGLNGLTIDEDGQIVMKSSDVKNLEGDFDAEFIDIFGGAEEVEGTFELSFE